MRAPISPGILLACLASVGLGLAGPAEAVKVSATYNASGSYSNTMSLTPKLTILDPGIANFVGAPSLAAPALFNTNTDAVSAFSFGTPLTAVQMTGDAISSISQPLPNIYDISLTLTNFTFSSQALAANEYVYLDLWETFTGLPGLSTATWSGAASVTGTACRTSPSDSLYIEPIATVYDPGSSSWIAASTFFGGTPLCGAIAASAPVNPLTPYISGGNLSVGFEAILGLNNVDLVGGDGINLPTSLHFKLRYDSRGPAAAPAPLPMAGAAVAWRVGRRLRQRLRTQRI